MEKLSPITTSQVYNDRKILSLQCFLEIQLPPTKLLLYLSTCRSLLLQLKMLQYLLLKKGFSMNSNIQGGPKVGIQLLTLFGPGEGGRFDPQQIKTVVT